MYRLCALLIIASTILKDITSTIILKFHYTLEYLNLDHIIKSNPTNQIISTTKDIKYKIASHSFNVPFGFIYILLTTGSN